MDTATATNSITASIRENLEMLAMKVKGDSVDLGDQLTAFLKSIEPDIETATALAIMGEETHVWTLRFIFDSVLMRAGRLTEGFLYKQKVLVATTIVATIRGAMGLLALMGPVGAIAAAVGSTALGVATSGLLVDTSGKTSG